MKLDRGLRLVAVFAVIGVVFATSACARRSSLDAKQASEDETVTLPPLTTTTPTPSPSPNPKPASQAAGASSSGSGSGSRGGAPAGGSGSTSSSGRVNCPSGAVSATLEDFATDEAPGETPDKHGEQEWVIRASGIVRNGTSTSVQNINVRVTVHVENADGSSHSVVISSAMGPGTTKGWTTRFRYDSEDEPDDDDTRVSIAGYTYTNSSMGPCPKPTA